MQKAVLGCLAQRSSVTWWFAIWLLCTASPARASEPDVQRLSAQEYRVARSRLDAALTWFHDAYQRGCFFIPFERDGRVVGVKVYGIKPTWLPAQVGLANGDMITAVNGVSLGSAEGAARVHDQLQHERHFTVQFERDGGRRALVIWVADR